MGRHSATNYAVSAGLVANLLLAALKVCVGIFAHSSALLADGINSTSDVSYYVVVAVFMYFSRKPADREHPYGHSQLESIAALVVGSFVVTTAIAVFWGAVNQIYDMVSGAEETQPTGLLALWIALFTIVAKIGLTVYTRRVGERTGNSAVMALAYDHRNDVISAAGAALGILLARSGYAWGDPLAGAVVSFVILRTGIEILRESSQNLMDTVPGESLEAEVRSVLSKVAGIEMVEEVLAHRFGPYVVMNVTIGIDGRMSVADGDAIASAVEKKLCREVQLVRRVYVHYHPTGAAQSDEPRPPLDRPETDAEP
jgi:cation diffusion facilitator family transporter